MRPLLPVTPPLPPVLPAGEWFTYADGTPARVGDKIADQDFPEVVVYVVDLAAFDDGPAPWRDLVVVPEREFPDHCRGRWLARVSVPVP